MKKMNHAIFTYDHEAGTAIRIAEIPDEHIDEMIEQIREWVSELSTSGRSREVWVEEVDEDKYAGYVEEKGASPIDMTNAQSRTFSSALHASKHIGFDTNQVAQALARARRQRSKRAIVRGVTFMYESDVKS